jgi:hypothetical protein
MCELNGFVRKLCDGSGWKSNYHFSLDRFQKAALAVRPRVMQPGLTAIADHLRAVDAARLAQKGRGMSGDHLMQEAVKFSRSRAPA